MLIYCRMSRAAADASVFYAIADPTRRAVLDLLRDGERTVGDLFEHVRQVAAGAAKMTQSAFSQHLAVLRRAGLVRDRKEGRLRYYAFEPRPLAEVVEWIVAYERFWEEKLDDLGRHLDRQHGPSRLEGEAPRGVGSEGRTQGGPRA
jgi:DNA-binding transcriptional ArsR family regulator